MTLNRTLWKRALAATGLVVLALQLAWWLPNRVQKEEVSDPDVYFLAAKHQAAGEQVYGRQQRARTDDVPAGFFYPPTALTLLSPFGHSSQKFARYFFFGLAILSTYALAAALVKIKTEKVDAASSIIVGSLLSIYPPVAMNMNAGNVDLAIIAMTAWAFAAPRFAAPLLVAAAAVKVYPAFALVAWLPRAGRKFQVDVLTCAMVVIFLTMGTVDLKYVAEWLTLGLPSLSEPSAHFGNWSLSTILIYPDLHAEVASTPRLARLILSCSPFVAAIAAAVCARRKSLEVAAAASLIAGTWFTALCWWWRILVLLMIPAALWLKKRTTI